MRLNRTLRRLQSLSSSLLIIGALVSHDLGTGSPDIPRWVFAGLLGFWGTFYVRADRVLCFVLFAGASLLWSPDWREGVDVFFGIIVLWGVYSLRCLWVAEAVTVSVLIVSILFWTYDRVYWAGYGNENFLTEFLIVSFPFIWMAQWRVIAVLALVGSLSILITSESDTRWFVLAGIGFWGVYKLFKVGRFYSGLFLILIPLNIAFMAGFWTDSLVKSLTERAELTFNSLVLWTQAPLFGHGIGSFNYMYPTVQEAHLVWGSETALHNVLLFVGAAHNEYAQGLAEFGLVGVGLALWVLMGHRISPPVFLVAIIALIGFPLQNTATALLFVLGLSQFQRLSPRWSLPALRFDQISTFMRRNRGSTSTPTPPSSRTRGPTSSTRSTTM